MTKNFGYEIKGADATETEKFLASRFVCPDAGILNSISVYIDNGDAVAHNIQVGIYNDDAGVIGTKLVSSASVSIPASFNDWKTINISASLVLGSAYWIGIQIETLNAAFFVWYDGGSADQRAYKAAWTYGDWSDNPVGLTYDAQKLSIYATYTEAEPTPYTWGMMFKNQIDPETIESAILRLIAVHEADPESHLAVGESLQSHKALAIIDHVAGSVLSDKLSNSEAFIKCNFESFDFWSSYGSTDYESIGLVKVTIVDDSPLSSGLYSNIFSTGTLIDYTKNMLFQVCLWLTESNVETACFGITGYFQTHENRGFGFLIENGAVKGYWGNNTVLTKTASLGVDPIVEHVYRAYYDAFLQNVKFYVDGVYLATIENVGPPNLDPAYLEFHLHSTANHGKSMLFRNLTFSRGI